MAVLSSQFSAFGPATPSASATGLLSRLLRSFQDARMRQAEAEVARLIESRGGRITDQVERQISKHFV